MISRMGTAASFRWVARIGATAAGLGVLIVLSGCATPGDLRVIHDDLFRIEEKLNVLQKDLEKRELARIKEVGKAPKPFELAQEVSKEINKEYSKESEQIRKNQADVRASLADMKDSLEVLRGELERHGYKISEVGRRLDSLDAKLAVRPSGTAPFPSPGATISQPSPGPGGVVALDPSQLYQTAYGDYQKGNYSWAILGFKEYLGKYPQSELADDAQYLLGESYYSLKDYLNAFVEFDKVPQLYSQSNLAPSAYLKSAYALLELKRNPEAKERLDAVIRKYPNTDEAKKAQERLKAAPKTSWSSPRGSNQF